jgi:hypothetical protein
VQALEEKYDVEEQEKGEKGPEKEEIDVHGRPFGLRSRGVNRRDSLANQTMAAAMFSFAVGSGLRGRRTLEEGGPNVVVWCNCVVGSWLVRDTCVDRFDEEEDRDEKEEEGGVMICCVGEEKEGDRNDGS